VWDSKSKQLTRDGHEIKLTKNERRLLELLSRDKNKVFSFFGNFWTTLSYNDLIKSMMQTR